MHSKLENEVTMMQPGEITDCARRTRTLESFPSLMRSLPEGKQTDSPIQRSQETRRQQSRQHGLFIYCKAFDLTRKMLSEETRNQHYH